MARLKSRIADVLERTSVSVVVLGPGEGNPHFQKRAAIRDHLSTRRSGDEVVFPEDIQDEELRAAGLGRTEAELVKECDLIIALIPPDGGVSGVFTELTEFVRIPGFVERLHVLRPDSRASSDASWGYAETRAYEVVDKSRFFDYPDVWWKECNDLRAVVSQYVEDERSRKMAIDFA